MSEQFNLDLRNKILGAMLREARQESGKTMKETAALIGSTSSILSSYEHGRKGIPLPELEVLSFFLNVPLRSFWAETKPTLQEEADFNPDIVIRLRQRMVGATLRTHREEARMSIQQLAETVDFPSSRIGAYERGERQIPLSELELLAEVLGHSIEEYIDREGPISDWLREQRAYEHYQTLPDEMRDFLAQADNVRYLRLAKRLSEISVEKLRMVAEILLEVTL